MAPIRFQVLNIFKKHIERLDVILEILAADQQPLCRYKAATMRRPIEEWYPMRPELDEFNTPSVPVNITHNQQYRIMVETKEKNCPLISIWLQGELRIATLRICLRSYWVSWSELDNGYLPLSIMDYITRIKPISCEDQESTEPLLTSSEESDVECTDDNDSQEDKGVLTWLD